MNYPQFPFAAWKKIGLPFKRVLVAKTTHLGDLIISLPMATALKQRDPDCTVIFLTNPCTVDVARCCPSVDEVYGEPSTEEGLVDLLASLNVDIFIQVNNSRTNARAAHRAGIPVRIGSLFHAHNFALCTHLVAISRSFSRLNKRMLDLQHLLPLGIKIDDPQVVAGMAQIEPPSKQLFKYPDHFAQGRRTIVLSPALITAQAHQWPLESYSRLIHQLDAGKFHWFICGTPNDREQLLPLIERHSSESNVTDLVGRLTLTEFMSFISRCDGLVAGSTGPLHLAAALGLHTLGIFQSRPTDIARWRPIGRSATIIHSDVRCRGERKGAAGARHLRCPCIVAIDPERVARQVLAWFEAPAN
jgi:ADP-heptose:LPS heptosyltransferase